MKSGIILLMVVTIFLACSGFVQAADVEKGDVQITALSPNMSLDEFQALWEKEGKTPEGSVRCLIIAVLETVKEENPDGKKMWGMVLAKDYVDKNGEPDSTQRLAVDQFSRVVKGTNFRGGIAASYLGGKPANGYASSYDAKVVVDENNTRRSDNEVKLFVRSGGKDNPSPVLLKRNKDGYWKVFEYSSLFTGVKPVENNDF
ncbi:MAG: hypothetical protein LWY06_03030 [Firmicutes bacterium]|nr:hypothetical protein [Bacillota bacterium]